MAEDEDGEDPKLPPDRRFDSLDERLHRAQAAEAKRTRRREPDRNYRIGQLVLGHLVGAPAGGFIIGFVLDRWLGTKPWLMLAGLFLGFMAGFVDVVPISKTPPGPGSGSGSQED